MSERVPKKIDVRKFVLPQDGEAALHALAETFEGMEGRVRAEALKLRVADLRAQLEANYREWTDDEIRASLAMIESLQWFCDLVACAAEMVRGRGPDEQKAGTPGE